MKLQTTQEREKFVSDIIATVAADLLDRTHKLPEHWTAYEIRQWIADRFAEVPCGFRRDKKTAYRRYLSDVRELNL